MPGIRWEEAGERGIETNRRRVPEISTREREGIRKFATLMPFKTPSYERGGTSCAISERGVGEGRHTIGGSAFAQGCNTFPNL